MRHGPIADDSEEEEVIGKVYPVIGFRGSILGLRSRTRRTTLMSVRGKLGRSETKSRLVEKLSRLASLKVR